MNDVQRECEKDARDFEELQEKRNGELLEETWESLQHQKNWHKHQQGQLEEARKLLQEWQSKYLYLQENEFLVGLSDPAVQSTNRLFERTTGFLDSTSC